MERLEETYSLKAGEKSDTIDLDFSECLGHCSTAPNILLGEDHLVSGVGPDTVVEKIKEGGRDISGQEIDIDAFAEDALSEFISTD